VGNITVPPELEDKRICYRVGANEVDAYQFHRWIERPRIMISEALVRTLRASGKYRCVTENSSSAAGDYILRGRLYEFDEVDVEPVDRGDELRQGVQPRLHFSPVVTALPIANRHLHRCHLQALRSIRHGFPFRPLSHCQAALEIG
jgi:hypothetical protein